MSEIDRMMEMEEMVSAKPNPTPSPLCARTLHALLSLSVSLPLSPLSLSPTYKKSLLHIRAYAPLPLEKFPATSAGLVGREVVSQHTAEK
jgi:hypothetical protein